MRKIAPKRSFTVGYKTVLKMINPKALVTNSNRSPANLKGKKNTNLPSVCSNFWLLLWLSVCVLTIWYYRPFGNCRSAILQRSAKPIASIHHTEKHHVYFCTAMFIWFSRDWFAPPNASLSTSSWKYGGYLRG